MAMPNPTTRVSSAVVASVLAKFAGFDSTKGGIKFAEKRDLSNNAFDALVARRRDEIDAALSNLAAAEPALSVTPLIRTAWRPRRPPSVRAGRCLRLRAALGMRSPASRFQRWSLRPRANAGST